MLAANVTESEECGGKASPVPVREGYALTVISPDEDMWTLLPLDEMQAQGYPAPGSPGAVKASRCSCSRVAYNLFSACAACQRISGAQWVEYSDWDQNCVAEGIDRHVDGIM